MSNNIIVTVELGPESQAKLDKILAALEGLHPNCSSCVETAVNMTKDLTAAAPAEEATNATEPTETAAPETEHPADEVSPHGEPEPVEEPERPAYTKADVLALVQKLAAPTSSKRVKAKEIVKSYAAKVSDIPADKYAEVMDKLTALDMEG